MIREIRFGNLSDASYRKHKDNVWTHVTYGTSFEKTAKILKCSPYTVANIVRRYMYEEYGETIRALIRSGDDEDEAFRLMVFPRGTRASFSVVYKTLRDEVLEEEAAIDVPDKDDEMKEIRTEAAAVETGNEKKKEKMKRKKCCREMKDSDSRISIFHIAAIVALFIGVFFLAWIAQIDERGGISYSSAYERSLCEGYEDMVRELQAVRKLKAEKISSLEKIEDMIRSYSISYDNGARELIMLEAREQYLESMASDNLQLIYEYQNPGN